MSPTTSISSSNDNEQKFRQALQSYQAQWLTAPTPASVSSRVQMHKVSPQLRMTEKKKFPHSPSIYDPIMVSLGPYHHGTKKDCFSRAEEFKHRCLVSFTGGVESKMVYFYTKILDKIEDIRGYYAEFSIVKQYDDNALAMMMLLDSCFILNFMENSTKNTLDDWYTSLGMAEAVKFTARDIMVLENQVPFEVLKLLIDGVAGSRILVQKFLSWILYVKFEHASIPDEDTSTPVHILEACWRVMAVAPQQITATDHSYNQQQPDINHQSVSSCPFKCPCLWRTNKSTDHLPLTNPDNQPSQEKTKYTSCPPVTDLKAKGISFRPSSSHSLKDIKFNSCCVYGELQLPVRSISELTQVFLSNMIAYEISRNSKTDLTVLSYTNFMKSLIETPADVKQLQEDEIIRFNRFANPEQVVKLFKSIDTFGLENAKIHADVMRRVGEHCKNKLKTWTAELFHSRLRSPWTIIPWALQLYL